MFSLVLLKKALKFFLVFSPFSFWRWSLSPLYVDRPNPLSDYTHWFTLPDIGCLMFGELGIPWLGWGREVIVLLRVFFTGALFCLYLITFDIELYVILDSLRSGMGCCPCELFIPTLISPLTSDV